MLYVSIQPRTIKIVSVRKGLLGSVETTWTSHACTKKLITEGTIASAELLRASFTTALESLPKKSSESDIVCVLDHTLYTFSRIDIPRDIEKSTYSHYIREKLRAEHKVDVKSHNVDFFIASYQDTITAFVYAIPHSTLITIRTAFDDHRSFKIKALVPEQLAYYTLFEKTVRFDKRENILYVIYEGADMTGYMYDTFGPLNEFAPWHLGDVDPTNIEQKLNAKVNTYAVEGHKLNRIIMSGPSSDKIRQDTFTKNVGVWTNPLKRIVPNFYQDYIMQIHGKSATDLLPMLTYDALFGAYICHAENKSFPFGKIGTSQKTITYQQTISHAPPPMKESPLEDPTIRTSIPFLKEIFLFFIIFVVVFAALYFLLQGKTSEGISLPSFLSTPTPSPTMVPTETPLPPSPTPTIEIKRSEVTIRILNGTGVSGQASTIKQALTTIGYTSILTANAANYNYTQSEVNIKSTKLSLLKDTILSDVKTSLTSPKVGQLDVASDVDIEIILGKDAK